MLHARPNMTVDDTWMKLYLQGSKMGNGLVLSTIAMDRLGPVALGTIWDVKIYLIMGSSVFQHKIVSRDFFATL